MNDNLTRYFAILRTLKQVFGFAETSHLGCHLLTLAALISGIVGSQKTHLPAIATKSPAARRGSTRESRQKRLVRWVQNEKVTAELFFAPFARAVLAHLSAQTLVLVMDGSEVGRGCLALVVSVVYQGRALPLAWTVVRGKKGHFSQEAHRALLSRIREWVPDHTPVRFLGDGEFDGVELLRAVDELGWQYICRTAKNIKLQDADGQWFSPQDLPLGEGQAWECPEVRFTAKAYGPVQVVALWEVGMKEPLYLVTNLEQGRQAPVWYKKRFRIETFFSDQKSRGFHLHKSHLSDPKRVARLMIAACLAYYWVVWLGDQVVRNGWLPLIHRKNRCDLSLFQIGCIWIEYCLDEGREIGVPIPKPRSSLAIKDVR